MEQEVEDERLFIDPNNIEASYAFSDAKRKLRMVLSNADLQHVPWRADRDTKVVSISTTLGWFWHIQGGSITVGSLQALYTERMGGVF